MSPRLPSRALPLLAGLWIVAACGPAPDWPEVRWGPYRPTSVDAHPTAETEVLVTQADGRVVIFGLVDGTWLRRRTLHGNVEKARWSLDGTMILGACRDGRMRAWNGNAELLWTTDSGASHERPILDLDLHEARIVTIGGDGTVRQWLSDGQPAAPPLRAVSPTKFAAVAISRDGRLLAAGGQNGRVGIWTRDGGKVRDAIDVSPRGDLMTRVGFLPDGRVAAATYDGRVLLESGNPERPIVLLERGEGGTLRLRGDGSILATDRKRRLWRWEFASEGAGGVIADDLEVVAVTAGGALWSMEVEKKGRGSLDARLRIVRPFAAGGEDHGGDSSPPLELAPRHDVRRLVMLPGERWLAVASAAIVRGTWDGKPAGPALKARGAPYDLAASPDGRWIAAGGDDPGGFRLWHRDRGEPVFAFSKINAGVLHTLRFTADGRYLAAHSGSWIRLWRLTGATIAELAERGGPKPVVPFGEPFQSAGHFGQSFDFSPDGETIAALTWDGRVRLFERAGGPRGEPFGEPGQNLVRVVSSPRGDLIAAAREWGDLVLYRWDGAVFETRANRYGIIRWLAFDPTGERLAIATDELIEIRRLEESGSRIQSAIPAPRSQQIGFHRGLLWSLGDQGHVLFWNRRGEIVRQMHLRDDGVLVLDAEGGVGGFGPLLEWLNPSRAH